MSDYRIEESAELPRKTLRAPFFVARDLKKQLHGKTDINILHDSPDSGIYVSPDIMTAIDAYFQSQAH